MAAPTPVDQKRCAVWSYGLAIFLSALLLFQVQLLIGKYFLSWFGGTPAMWTTCMFFFQTLLLIGYIYAHVVADWVPLRLQARIHVIVLLLAIGWLLISIIKWHFPLMPDAAWKPSGPENPVWHLSILLAVSAGVPFFCLSTTGPLLQKWFSQVRPGVVPYRLYALSNLGSFLGLLTYPFLVEPWFTLQTQAWLWSVMFALFALSCGYCALRLNSTAVPRQAVLRTSQHVTQPPGLLQIILWLGLSACGSLLFLATSNEICQNIAVVPLLWVLPLSIYLLSLVICFDRQSWYSRAIFQPALALSLVLAIFLLNGGALTRLVTQILSYSLVLFISCMVCHGELARSKPVPQHLTLFYLMVAAGGAIAGVFVVLIAPHIFSSFWEYQLALWSVVLFTFLALLRDRDSWLYTSKYGLPFVALGATLLPGAITVAMRGRTSFAYIFLVLVVLSALYFVTRNARPGFDAARAKAAPFFVTVALLVLGFVLFLSTRLQIQSAMLVVRNFYGVLTIRELNHNDPEWAAYGLWHGMIPHGFQFRSQSKTLLATGYYGISSGVGQAVAHLRGSALAKGTAGQLRIGVVGLGVGTLAAYAKSGDYFRFYEINPAVTQIARDPTYFTYLKDCPANVNVIPGDARLSMEKELAQNQSPRFNLLVIDAFNGDAIPVHLLTEQAFRLYQDEIQANGIIAVHITNTFIDLRPVIAGVAEKLMLDYQFLQSNGDDRVTKYNDWALLGRETALRGLKRQDRGELDVPGSKRLWTDNYSNLLQLLR